MAKQVFHTIISGAIDNLVFYAMEGRGYVAAKEALPRKILRQSFMPSCQSAACFAAGHCIAGAV